MNPKILAFYLPQFHEIPENNKWHGNGFTEWTKVRASTPLFESHKQPVRPHSDIGYYALDDKTTLETQAQLMKKYGVDGQIMYRYWFAGKQILEKPAEILLNSPEIEMPFAFCWANENWTKRWDGGNGKVLLKQEYSSQDAKAFILNLIPYLKDPRYIRVDGRPLILIYRTANIPNLKQYIRIWKEICSEMGVNEPFVLAVQTMNDPRIVEAGIDGEVERPMYNFSLLKNLEERPESTEIRDFQGRILEYGDVKDFYLALDTKNQLDLFPTVLAGWDVSPRHALKSNILLGFTPNLFREWLIEAIKLVTATFPESKQLVFVNAWNEWAEGAFLEPDELWGYQKLEAVSAAKMSTEEEHHYEL